MLFVFSDDFSPAMVNRVCIVQVYHFAHSCDSDYRSGPSGAREPRSGGSRKKIFGGAWPLIIWEATTAKRNLSEITIEPINSTSSRTTVSKNLGEGEGGQDLGGCAPWPQRRTATGAPVH